MSTFASCRSRCALADSAPIRPPLRGPCARINRQRVPVRGLIPSVRHACALLTPRATSRANRSCRSAISLLGRWPNANYLQNWLGVATFAGIRSVQTSSFRAPSTEPHRSQRLGLRLSVHRSRLSEVGLAGVLPPLPRRSTPRLELGLRLSAIGAGGGRGSSRGRTVRKGALTPRPAQSSAAEETVQFAALSNAYVGPPRASAACPSVGHG